MRGRGLVYTAWMRSAPASPVLRRCVYAALVPLVLGVGACARERDPIERATRDIRTADIDAAGKALASEALLGRRHASAGADSAVALLHDALRARGLAAQTRAADLRHGPPGFFEHYFDVTLSRPARRTRLSFLCEGRSHHARAGEGFLPLVFSGEGDVLGIPTRLDDAQQLALGAARFAGRVVRVSSSAVQRGVNESADRALYRIALRLTELGAAAVLFDDVAGWQSLASTTYPGSLADDTLARLAGVQARRAHWTVDRYATLQQSRAWSEVSRLAIPVLVLAPGLSAAACSEVRVRVAFDHEVSLGRNLVALLPGAPGVEPVVLSAHYDQAGLTGSGEVVRGAHDNASGVAALLEVTRALRAVHTPRDRPVVVCFTGAELLGGLGTAALLRDWGRVLELPPPRASLLIEAVGRGGDRLQVVGPANDDGVALFDSVNTRAFLDAGALLLEPRRFRAPAAGTEFEPGPHAYSAAHWDDAGVRTWTLHDGDASSDDSEDAWKRVDVGKVTRVARLVFHAARMLGRMPAPGEALPAAAAR